MPRNDEVNIRKAISMEICCLQREEGGIRVGQSNKHQSVHRNSAFPYRWLNSFVSSLSSLLFLIFHFGEELIGITYCCLKVFLSSSFSCCSVLGGQQVNMVHMVSIVNVVYMVMAQRQQINTVNMVNTAKTIKIGHVQRLGLAWRGVV